MYIRTHTHMYISRAKRVKSIYKFATNTHTHTHVRGFYCTARVYDIRSYNIIMFIFLFLFFFLYFILFFPTTNFQRPSRGGGSEKLRERAERRTKRCKSHSVILHAIMYTRTTSVHIRVFISCINFVYVTGFTCKRIDLWIYTHTHLCSCFTILVLV